MHEMELGFGHMHLQLFDCHKHSRFDAPTPGKWTRCDSPRALIEVVGVDCTASQLGLATASRTGQRRQWTHLLSMGFECIGSQTNLTFWAVHQARRTQARGMDCHVLARTCVLFTAVTGNGFVGTPLHMLGQVGSLALPCTLSGFCFFRFAAVATPNSFTINDPLQVFRNTKRERRGKADPAHGTFAFQSERPSDACLAEQMSTARLAHIRTYKVTNVTNQLEVL